MKKIVPELLKSGDEIRIIAPATGIKILSEECVALAKQRFETLGLKVTFGSNTVAENWDMSGSTSIEKRVEDLHQAFTDKNVKAVFTVIGGSNSNQLLDYIDYKTIAENPKIFCGFSDITALLNAIHAQTGLVTFSGPHFSSLGMLKGIEYTIENMRRMLMEDGKNQLCPSPEWSDDLWFLDQQNREFIKNDGYWKLQEGTAEGTLIGGNLGTFNLLLGTKYRPEFKPDTILFIEDTESTNAAIFTRNLQALIQQPDFQNVKGILIGRFQKKSNVTREQLEFMVKRFENNLKGMPIIANLDFGHSTPLLTIPVGGTATIGGQRIKMSV
uniref:LD-carboxypeptidase n=1 Tax=uncultured Alphaproteobacteria bacterium TaxID=91750 RepID=A0A6G8F2L7_9PROT|nr:LD-carboxypeptidase [uncultured Alphaproteobacteria bacterium]